MDDIEFKPYDDQNLKRIGTKNEDAGQKVEKRPFNINNFKPSNFKFIFLILIALIGILSFKYYKEAVLNPKQTKTELLEIKSALYLYKESFGAYPNQLTELTKSRPLREAWLTDAWGNPYRYVVDDSTQSFIVSSAGYDGGFGTEDDIQVK